MRDLREVFHVRGHRRLALGQLGQLEEELGATTPHIVDQVHHVRVHALRVCYARLAHHQVLLQTSKFPLLPSINFPLHLNRPDAQQGWLLLSAVQSFLYLPLQDVYLLLEEL